MIFMKRCLFCILLTLMVCGYAYAGEPPCEVDSCAKFEIIGPSLCELGNINKDEESVSSSFWIKSTGLLPMIIVSSSTSCPCTHVVYDSDIINPGDSIEIKMTVEFGSHIGDFLQSVLLKTNTKPQDYVWFYMKGCIVDEARKD